MRALQIILISCALGSFVSCKGKTKNSSDIEPIKIDQSSDPNHDMSSTNSVDIENQQDSLKCNISIIHKTDSEIKEITYQDIDIFLCTFSKSCSRNIEFTEYSNEVLFKVLELYPSLFMKCVELNSEIEKEYIFSELSSPLYDINGEKLKSIIQQAEGSPDIKIRIIQSIEKAME
ncbi:MAG: hypothetical protein K9H26_13580 [Prolixibacteraceae bacterium]|nr:hypothetical protein [Prolixibacteraceae bacterium]